MVTPSTERGVAAPGRPGASQGVVLTLWRRAIRHLWPRSLAGHTAVLLVMALTVVQAGGLVIHAMDQLDLQRLAQTHEIALRAISLYRAVAMAAPDQRAPSSMGRRAWRARSACLASHALRWRRSPSSCPCTSGLGRRIG